MWKRRYARTWTLVLVVPVLVVSACSSGGSSGGATGQRDDVAVTSAPASDRTDGVADADPGSGTELTLEQAAEILALFEKGEPVNRPILGLDEYRADPAVLAVALRELEAGSERWVDVYVWANAGLDPAPLRRFLAHPEPGLRFMAAAGLLSMGDPDGFAPIIDLLTDTTIAGHYPTPLWQLATTVLARLAPIPKYGPTYDASPTQREAAQLRWRTWAESISTSTFDQTTGLWGAP